VIVLDDARLVYDRETGKPKGYGFCEYQDLETAQSAMRNLNNHDFNGRPLRVGVAAGEQTKEENRGMQQALGGPAVEVMMSLVLHACVLLIMLVCKLYMLDGNRGHQPTSRYSLMMMILTKMYWKQPEKFCLLVHPFLLISSAV